MISVRSLQRSEGDVSDPIKYLFLIRISSRVDLAMSFCPSVRPYGITLRTIRAILLRFGMQIQQAAQNCGSYSFDARIKFLAEMYCSHQYQLIDPKKNLPRQL